MTCIPKWYSRPLMGGEVGTDVTVVNRKLGVGDWAYSEASQQYVRGLQQAHNLPITGIVDEETATVLGEAADSEFPPSWFRRPLSLGDQGEDVAEASRRLLSTPVDTFGPDLERAVRRFQSSRHLPLTGKIDESLSLLIP